MSKRKLPCSDYPANRNGTLLAGIGMMGFAAVIFYRSVTLAGWGFILLGFVPFLLGALCIISFVRQYREQKDFVKNDWEKKVHKAMKEDALASLSPTELMNELAQTPRSISFLTCFAFLLTLLPFCGGPSTHRDNLHISLNELPLPLGQCAGLVFYWLFLLTPASMIYLLCFTDTEKFSFVVLFSLIFFLSLALVPGMIAFGKGWRILHLLRCGKATTGILRSHWVTGEFYQYLDEAGQPQWGPLSVIYKVKDGRRVTVLFDPRAPRKSLVLDHLIQEKKIYIDEKGELKLARCRIFSILAFVLLPLVIYFFILRQILNHG